MVEWTSQKSTKELRIDTRPVSCWCYHYYLLIWRCLRNYDVRYLCTYIKSHRSDVSSVNAVEATFAVIYLWLLFSAGLNLSIKYVSYDSLKILLSSRIAENGIILKFPPRHVLIWPLASICCGLGCEICWLEAFNLSLSIIYVCPIYSFLQPLQITT